MSCKEQVQSLFIIRDLFGCLLWIPFPLVTEFPLFSENHRLESAYQNHLIVKLVLVGVLIYSVDQSKFLIGFMPCFCRNLRGLWPPNLFLTLP